MNYEVGRPPWVESYLQDFFGMRGGPALLDGAQPLTLHLLAPNRRAVQVTTDLAGFWLRHYPELRRQLSRRYPAMDRFRVLALLAALDREREAPRCAALVAELEAKLDILSAGSRKRGHEARVAMLAAIRARLSAADYGRPHDLSRQEIRDGF